MGLTRLAIARPVVILMMVAAFLTLGLVAYTRLPAELNPQVDFPRISIRTTYTGTDPQEMETLITKPIEDSVSGVSGIQQITSVSAQGQSVVQIQFYFGTNLDSATSDVIQKVDAIRKALPTAADAPAVIKADTSGQPIMHLVMQSKARPERELQSLATNVVQPALEQATDVGSVNVATGVQREIQVNISAATLAAYNITVSDVANAIANSNINISSGFIQSGNQYYNVRLLGEFASVDEIKNLRLNLATGNATGEAAGNAGSGGGGGGATGGNIAVNLSDIAQIVDTGSEKTQDSFLSTPCPPGDTCSPFGTPGIGIDILKTTDGNTLAASDSVKKQLKSLAKILPPDITFAISTDQSNDVHNNLSDVVTSLFLGALLAILVVYLFLHNPRGTIIIAIAIPTSMIATFGPMYAAGFTLNSLSLLGLSLAVGILVDDSIVVLENINRHLAMGENPVEAAINGRSEIGYAALTLTSVDLVVFLPIGFMGGVIGEFFRSFGVTVAIATLFSLFVSFTLTPMMAARWYKKGERLEYDRGFAGAFDRGFGRVEHWYRGVLRSALRHPWFVVIAGNVFLVLIFATVGKNVGFRFAPDQDQNQVSVQVQCPAGSSINYTEGITRQIEQIVRTTPDLNADVKYVATNIGNAGPGQNLTGTQYANMVLTLYDKHTALDSLTFWKHEHLRFRADSAVAKELGRRTQNIPGARILTAAISGFGGGAAPLEVDLTGPDFTQLSQAAAKVQAQMAQVPGAYNVDNSFKNSEPQVEVRLDRTKAPAYGLSVLQVANALSDAVAGNVNSQFRDPADGEQYPIRVQLAKADRSDPTLIANTVVGYQGASPIHLGDIADVSVGVGPVKIDRFDRQREIAVTAFLQPGYPPGTASAQMQEKLKTLDLGQVSYTFGGEARSINQEGGYLAVAFLLGLGLSYMLMAALFNNMIYPLSIMLSVPQAWAGALIALAIAHEPLSLIAMIGFVLLNAIVNKNAILLVDYTNTLRARGYKRMDALLEAAPVRLRPILMTTLTIIVSTLPTAMALGRGAGFRQPLGVATIGGITLSLFLTLLVIPCAYLLFDNFGNWVYRITRRNKPDGGTDAYTPPTIGGNGRFRNGGAANGVTDGHADGLGPQGPVAGGRSAETPG